MFNLDELVKNEEIQLNGEILHVKPILKRYADRFLNGMAKLMKSAQELSKYKDVSEEDLSKEEIEKINKFAEELAKAQKDINKLLAEFLSNNEENKQFKLDDIEQLSSKQANALIGFISEQINAVEKK